MKKLTTNTKPKYPTFRQMYDLYCVDSGKETPELIVKVLDTFYPKFDRKDVVVETKYSKYKELSEHINSFFYAVKNLGGE